MRMHARIATPGDEILVSRLLLASYTELMAGGYEAAVLAAALPRLVRANPSLLGSGTFYVVDGPGASIIGCGGWTLADPATKLESQGLAHVRHFATHPNFVRQGIGRLIYSKCAEAATLAGVTKFQAYASLNAVQFYNSVGLVLIRAFELSLGGDIKFPAALMQGNI